VMLMNEGVKEGSEAPGFDVEVTGGPDEPGEPGLGKGEKAVRIKEMGGFEIGDGAFDVGPVGILGEDGADTDLEGGIAGPPVLVSEVCAEQGIDAGQAGVDTIGRCGRSVHHAGAGLNSRRAVA
jgi:hypothetical protein